MGVNLGNLAHERLEKYPMPIAAEWAQLVDSQLCPKSRHRHLQSLIDVVLRYCTLIMLNDYQLDSRQLTSSLGDRGMSKLKEVMGKIESCLDGVTVDNSWSLLKELTEVYALANRSDLLFVPELYHGLWDEKGEPTSLQTDWQSLVNQYKFSRRLFLEFGKDLWEGNQPHYFEHQFPRLASIIERLAFLCDYPLLCIEESTSEGGGSGSGCEEYSLMGSKWNNAVSPRWSEAGWRSDQLFLRNPARDGLLRLHPFILLGRCDECAKEDFVLPFEVFLYDRAVRREVGTSTAIWIDHNDRHEWQAEWSLIEEVVDGLKEAIKEAVSGDRGVRIGWRAAVDRGRGYSEDKLRRIRRSGKYNPDLYFPRREIKEELDHFLASDDITGFVVVGDSGVGKTNLLYDLASREAESRPDDIVLFFPCADHLRDAAPEKLFATALLLGDDVPLEDIFRELDRRRPFGGRMIVVFDAIDRHDAPAAFLEAINHRLVRMYHKYPWFKIVISCRSSTWDLLQLENIPSPRFFTQVDGQLAVPLLPFFERTAGHRAVCESYFRKYGFSVSYDDLSLQAQRFLSDPLMLFIVCEAYEEEGEIPEDVETLKVFQEYVEEKIESISDKRILVDRLVDLMYERKANALDVVELKRDSEIGKFVSARQQQGRSPAHQSPYVRLLSEGVIYETNDAPGVFQETRVSFTHDRLFEYLLAEKTLPEKPRKDDLIRLIEETHDYPSFWWAIRAGLSARFDSQLMAELAAQDDLEVRGLLLDTLSLAAQDNPETVSCFLNGLLTKDCRSSRLLGVMAACQTGDIDVIRKAIDSNDDYTHSLGIQYAYYTWKRNPRAGEALIRGIASELASEIASLSSSRKVVDYFEVPIRVVRRRLAGNQRLEKLFKSYIELSGYLATHLMRELQLVRPFLNDWSEILGRIRSFPDLFRGPILRHGTESLIAGFEAREGEEEGGVMNRDALSRFFDLPEGTREKMALVAEYIDPNVPGDYKVRQMIVELSQTPDAMICFMLTPLLVCRCVRDRERGVELIREVFGTGVPIAQYTAQKALAVWLTPLVLDAAPASPDPELEGPIQQLEDFQMLTWMDPECSITIGERTYELGIGHVFYLILFEALLHPGETKTIDKFIETPPALLSRVVPEADLQVATILHMIRGVADIGMLGSDRYLQAVLPLLGRWLDLPEAEVQQQLVRAFALLRTQAPQLVDAQFHRWAEEEARRDQIGKLRRKVSGNPVEESAGTRLSRSGLMAMQSFPFLDGAPPYIAEAVSKIAGESQDFAHAMRIIVDTILDAAQPRAERRVPPVSR